mmetsp:Transcript_36065/g.81487  ORF Transcript_36065/g.81487 Transcript_36065/m.81487 type:complete len:254 (-) Transcript_36065:48-809(-)
MGCVQSGSAAEAAEDIVIVTSTDGGGGTSSSSGGPSGGAISSSSSSGAQHGPSSTTGGIHRTLHQGSAHPVRPAAALGGVAGPRAHEAVARVPSVSGAAAAHGVRRLLASATAGDPALERSVPPTGFSRSRPAAASAPELAHFMLQYRDLRPEDFDLLSKLDDGVPKRGTAPPGFVDHLPKVRARDCGSAECGVCLGTLASDFYVARLPCRHAFHTECISRWLTECRSTCPLCAAPVKTDAQPPAAASRAERC